VATLQMSKSFAFDDLKSLLADKLCVCSENGRTSLTVLVVAARPVGATAHKLSSLG